jgi:A/G-specific adenine glycosylase
MTLPDPTALLAPLGPWFHQVQRAMPWRTADLDRPHPDPYRVLVAEIMLQQTQVATVIPYFQRWLVRFPDLAALAGAGEDELHRFWAGLGYYRRARLLQGAARALVADGWPRDLAGLARLPGLGPYTAAAVGAQAFLWPTPALDGNAFRVLARLLALEADPRRQAPALREWLAPALARIGPSRLTQAIMELGATVCLPSPRCPDCPLRAQCRARLEGSVQRIPPPRPRPAPKAVTGVLAAVRSPQGWLLRPPAAKGLLAGLWSWPWLEGAPAEPLASGAGMAGAGAAEVQRRYGAPRLQGWPGWVQVYSHRRETIRPLLCQLSEPRPAPPGLVWIAPAELAELPMGSRDQRLRALVADPGPDPAPWTWAELAAALFSAAR